MSNAKRAATSVDELCMSALLEGAGFRLRGGTALSGNRRADCAHCTGNSRGTVSFTAEVAYCHRCRWSRSRLALARELGLVRGNSRAAAATPFERERRRRLQRIREFEAWRKDLLDRIIARLRSLHFSARMAHHALERWPDWEPAWDALKRLYDQEAELYAAFDALLGVKATIWLETPMDVTALYEIFLRTRNALAP
jgi:hypothetical protein